MFVSDIFLITYMKNYIKHKHELIKKTTIIFFFLPQKHTQYTRKKLVKKFCLYIGPVIRVGKYIQQE